MTNSQHERDKTVFCACPNCGKIHSFLLSQISDKRRCKCTTRFLLKPNVPPKLDSIGQNRKLRWPCPVCSEKISIKPSLLDRKLKCPHCSSVSKMDHVHRTKEGHLQPYVFSSLEVIKVRRPLGDYFMFPLAAITAGIGIVCFLWETEQDEHPYFIYGVTLYVLGPFIYSTYKFGFKTTITTNLPIIFSFIFSGGKRK